MEIFVPGSFIEQAEQTDAIFVANCCHIIGTAYIMYPGYVFVADAFDAVFAKPVIQHGGAFHGLSRGDHGVGAHLFQVIPGGDGASGSGCTHKRTQSVCRFFDVLEGFPQRAAGYLIVPK